MNSNATEWTHKKLKENVWRLNEPKWNQAETRRNQSEAKSNHVQDIETNLNLEKTSYFKWPKTEPTDTQ